jgi:hypothetical protein
VRRFTGFVAPRSSRYLTFRQKSVTSGIDSPGSWLFFLSVISMVTAMIQFTIEIQIANSLLDVHLSDLEKHQEWQDYLTTSKPGGK